MQNEYVIYADTATIESVWIQHHNSAHKADKRVFRHSSLISFTSGMDCEWTLGCCDTCVCVSVCLCVTCVRVYCAPLSVFGLDFAQPGQLSTVG